MELNIKKTEAAFNKFGYTTADIQAMVKKGMKPAEILAIISESKKSRGTTGGHEVIE